MATDMWLNIVARDINLKMYWAEPTISIQCSEFDVRLFNKSYTYINS